MELTRKDKVLKGIVEEFVKTAAPVGSKTLLENYDLKCSSATIRNTMVELEKEGLIEKTHVSSGRVPSAKGYQYYLNYLDESSMMNNIDMEFQREFKQIFQNKTRSVEEVLSKSCEMLSELTNTATMVLGPKAEEERLVSIQLLKLSENTCMGIFITDSGYIEKQTFVLPKDGSMTFTAASSAVKLLDERLNGTKISELRSKLTSLSPILTKSFGSSAEFLLQSLLEAIVGFAKKRFTVYGKKNLLSLPEFSDDSQAFLNAIDALEDPSSIEHDISHNDDLGSVRVGFTNGQHGDLAIIKKPIYGKDEIAVVGPKRMDYKKVLSALEYIVYMINRYFSSDVNNTALIPVSEPTEITQSKTTKKTKSTKKRKEANK